MAATPETEVVKQIREEYRYGFSNPDEAEAYFYKSGRGLSHEVVEAIAEHKKEPAWMRKFRHKSLDYFLARPLPEWGGNLNDIDFDNIYYYIKPTEKQASSWEDLRRDRLQRNIRLRGQMVGVMRRLMEDAGFVDIQTPILWKPTPEGARDFLVPARLQPAHFYALPQSPQIAKQLLVIAGFERYYQVAVCFRDEDLRADRVQEITQLDVEMAFPDYEFLLGLMERMVTTVWQE